MLLHAAEIIWKSEILDFYVPVPFYGQTGRNADKIPCHTSEVNYVCMVLHCALSSTREGEVFSQRGSGFRQLCLLIPTKRNPWHEFITCSFIDID